MEGLDSVLKARHLSASST